MRRGLWILLVFSLALNVGLLSAGIMHWADMRREEAAALAGSGDGAPGTGAPGAPVRGSAARRGPGRGMAARHGGGMDVAGMGSMSGRMLRHWPERRIDRLGRELDLSPEQRAQLARSLEALSPEIRDQAGRLMQERTRLHRAFMAGSANADSVRTQARMVAEAQARLDSLVAEAMMRENAVLSPEQRARYGRLEWGPGAEGRRER